MCVNQHARPKRYRNSTTEPELPRAQALYNFFAITTTTTTITTITTTTTTTTTTSTTLPPPPTHHSLHSAHTISPPPPFPPLFSFPFLLLPLLHSLHTPPPLHSPPTPQRPIASSHRQIQPSVVCLSFESRAPSSLSPKCDPLLHFSRVLSATPFVVLRSLIPRFSTAGSSFRSTP